MSENLPQFAQINFEGDVVPANRENTVIYQHLGKNAMYDHVFVTHPTKDFGAYIWAQLPPDNQNYIDLALVAEEAQVPMHINIPEPSRKDLKAFMKTATRDIEGMQHLPDDWA